MSNRSSQPPNDARSPIAEAMQWVSRITTVALMTVLPILGGGWLDGRFATKYWGLVGLVVGLVLGGWQLMLLVRVAGASGGAGASRSGAWKPGASKHRGFPVEKSPPAVSASTAEIAKEIDDVLKREKKSSDREP
jgi:hypothetical protein